MTMQAVEARLESRFNLLARAMRTLVDLLHTEHGYARIFHDQEGFSYELHCYRRTPTADLFTRMLGYASAEAAIEAARLALDALHSARRPKANRARKSQSAHSEVTQLILPVEVH
ncbi:MAG: hypothetical protein ABW171_15285 [Steroidobacter sp.]